MKENADPFLAVDWGSSHLRAKLMIDGHVADRISTPDGIRFLRGQDFDEILGRVCAPWKKTHGNLRVLLSGMIGSREGWVETPYVSVPAGLPELANGLVDVPSRHFPSVQIIPGVRFDDPGSSTTDVMRGEETQILGLMPRLPPGNATVCIPGTHSKWITCRDHRMARFRTWLTGEAFDRLTHQSLISGDETAPVDPESTAFHRGVEISTLPGGMLHHLFLGRTEMLMDRLRPEDLPSFVSGLLIGQEIGDAESFSLGPLFLVGDSPAALAMAAALKAKKVSFTSVREDVHAQGILALQDRRTS